MPSGYGLGAWIGSVLFWLIGTRGKWFGISERLTSGSEAGKREVPHPNIRNAIWCTDT